ncbi:DUF2141 domain-containing protein [Chitinimonas lacunae]|uniref:DUF2141 domain-containing protein n=1 Tax=Chitinimonas lacunae TaxID=1963018 RepID=A0ABV8MPW6_9NEIS
MLKPVLAALLALSAHAGGTLEIEVANVMAGKGQLLIGLCKKSEFLTPHCSHNQSVPASKNPQPIQLTGVPAGEYALQVVYDRNSNYRMDVNNFGAPIEPIGFSRDAVGKMGPPRFDDARFTFNGQSARLRVHVY